MYYCITQNEKDFKIIEIETEHEVYKAREKYDIVGTFGRLDYAEHWKKWYGGEITEKKHRCFLGLF